MKPEEVEGLRGNIRWYWIIIQEYYRKPFCKHNKGYLTCGHDRYYCSHCGSRLKQ